jgi:hypothetical protein
MPEVTARSQALERSEPRGFQKGVLFLLVSSAGRGRGDRRRGRIRRRDPCKRLRELVKAEVARQKAEPKSWPAVTDCDPLDQAFAALEAAGQRSSRGGRAQRS